MLRRSIFRRFLVLSHDGDQAIAIHLVERGKVVLWPTCILTAPGVAGNPKYR